MDKETVELINGMQHRINTLEYILAQSLALSVRNTDNPDSIILDIQAKYAVKMAELGVTEESGDKGFESAVRIYTSAKNSF